MEPWLILAIVGAVLAISEIFTTTFFLLPAGIAFLLSAALSPVLSGWPVTFAVLAGFLALTYLLFYFAVWPRLRKTAVRETGASGMVGKIATVTEAITLESGVGYVQLYGDSWRAVSESAFDVGAKVQILATEGNKVIVGIPGP